LQAGANSGSLSAETRLHAALGMAEATAASHALDDICAALGGCCMAISPLRIVKLMHERLGNGSSAVPGPGSGTPPPLLRERERALLQAAHCTTAGVAVTDTPLRSPLLLAAGVLVSARRAAGIVPAWPAVLAKLTGVAAADGRLAQAVELVEGWAPGPQSCGSYGEATNVGASAAEQDALAQQVEAAFQSLLGRGGASGGSAAERRISGSGTAGGSNKAAERAACQMLRRLSSAPGHLGQAIPLRSAGGGRLGGAGVSSPGGCGGGLLQAQLAASSMQCEQLALQQQVAYQQQVTCHQPVQRQLSGPPMLHHQAGGSLGGAYLASQPVAGSPAGQMALLQQQQQQLLMHQMQGVPLPPAGGGSYAQPLPQFAAAGCGQYATPGGMQYAMAPGPQGLQLHAMGAASSLPVEQSQHPHPQQQQVLHQMHQGYLLGSGLTQAAHLPAPHAQALPMLTAASQAQYVAAHQQPLAPAAAALVGFPQAPPLPQQQQQQSPLLPPWDLDLMSIQVLQGYGLF